MKQTLPCPICSKNLELVSSVPFSDTQTYVTYKCGHCFLEEKQKQLTLDFASCDGKKKARGYQEQGVEFIFESGFNCVVADQMRLGKTPQALLALKNSPEHHPCLILVRAANFWQWIREYKTWTSADVWGIYPIVGTKNFVPPGFKTYICSMDTFSRKGMSDQLQAFGFKLVIVDEAHSFKNTDSNRSQALTTFLMNVNRADITHEVPFTCSICKHQWTEEVTVKMEMGDTTRRVSKTSYCAECGAQVSQSAAAHVKVKRSCDVIMLTGTPIKNRADEYFVPLNLVAPDKFTSLDRFRKEWLTQDAKGKYSKVSPRVFEEFKQRIAPYVLRREKEDVYTDLPTLDRTFTVTTISDERIKKAYNKVVDELEAEMERKPNLTFFDSIGHLQQLRQICGMAKVDWAADYATESLQDSDKQKLAIGIHHKAVRDTLAFKLSDLGVMKLSGEDSAARKDEIMVKFETASEQVLVINMLAGGVGMDFHYVNNCLVLERQWNSADEEQFEFRFYNPDKSIKTAPTHIEYVLAQGTIDEWFYDLVEEKRAIFGETISNHWKLEDDAKGFKQLLERTVAGRL